jgi:hypothetical protein
MAEIPLVVERAVIGAAPERAADVPPPRDAPALERARIRGDLGEVAL